MSYEKERAIAEAATQPTDGECACEACWLDMQAFIDMANPQFVRGLLDKLERYETALERIAAFPWPTSINSPVRIARTALNPTEANGCAACRREGRCDVHLRLDIEATEATDDHE